MTRSHTNKATFSPPFLHPPSPSTATNAMPPTTDHTGEARGHGRRHTVGVQGTPTIFLFYLLFHLLRLDPQQPQHVPLHGKRADAPLLPPTTNPRCPPPAEHKKHALGGVFFVFGMSPHPEHQNVPLWACSGVPSSPPSFRTPESAHVGTFWCSCTSPLPFLNTRTCTHGHVLVLTHLPSLSPSSRTPERARVGLFWCSRTSPLPLL